MSPSKTSPNDTNLALMRAVKAYPAAAYSPNDPSKPDADEKLLQAIQAYFTNYDWSGLTHPNVFSRLWYENLSVVSATKSSATTGKTVLRFPVLPEYANYFQTLAGGAHGIAHDYGTGWALLTIAQPGFWVSTGASLHLSVTFLQPAKVGDVLLLESEIVQAGGRIAVLKGTLRRERDGAIVSLSEHTKSNIDSKPAKM